MYAETMYIDKCNFSKFINLGKNETDAEKEEENSELLLL